MPTRQKRRLRLRNSRQLRSSAWAYGNTETISHLAIKRTGGVEATVHRFPVIPLRIELAQLCLAVEDLQVQAPVRTRAEFRQECRLVGMKQFFQTVGALDHDDFQEHGIAPFPHGTKGLRGRD